MAITKAKALLVEMANTLATEATAAGKTALATSLTDFGSEIAIADDEEFFVSSKFDSVGSVTTTSGKGITYSNILQSAAAVVQSKGINALTDIKSSQATIATDTTGILAQETIIAAKQTAIETYQKKLKELGEGPGIHILSPNEIFGFIKLYQLLIEQGKMLDEGDKVSEAQQANAKAKAKEMAQKVQTLLNEISVF